MKEALPETGNRRGSTLNVEKVLNVVSNYILSHQVKSTSSLPIKNNTNCSWGCGVLWTLLFLVGIARRHRFEKELGMNDCKSTQADSETQQFHCQEHVLGKPTYLLTHITNENVHRSMISGNSPNSHLQEDPRGKSWYGPIIRKFHPALERDKWLQGQHRSISQTLHRAEKDTRNRSFTMLYIKLKKCLQGCLG